MGGTTAQGIEVDVDQGANAADVPATTTDASPELATAATATVKKSCSAQPDDS